jgi:hypothetical protein
LHLKSKTSGLVTEGDRHRGSGLDDNVVDADARPIQSQSLWIDWLVSRCESRQSRCGKS